MTAPEQPARTPQEAAGRAWQATGDWEMAVEAALVAARLAAAQERPAPGERDALEAIARAAQGHIDSSGAVDHDWLRDTALRGLGWLDDGGTETAPQPAPELAAATDETSGQAAHDAFFTTFGTDVPDWPPLGPGNVLAAWNDAAKAAQKPFRDAITELLTDVTASANATRPSKKTSIEDEVAIALRKLLETP